MPMTESRAQQSVRFNAEAAVVAAACQEVLRSVGKVTTVSRETGTIFGRIGAGFLNYTYINITIQKMEGTTEVSVQTQRKEGLVTSGGAQKTLADFLRRLGSHPSLKQSASTGW